MLKNPVTPASHPSQYMGHFFFARSYFSLGSRSVAGPRNERFRDTQELKGRIDDAQQRNPVEISILKLNILGSSLQPAAESYDEFE
jgi:hypothetical protein